MRLGILMIPAAVFVLARAAAADTTWVSAGNVSGQWTAAGSPYMVLGTITVPTDSTLDIGPGITIFFVGQYSLNVDSSGTISALGAEADSICFTAAVLEPYGWNGINLYKTADTCRFRYCIVTGAGCDGDCHAIKVFSSPLDLTHSSLRFNQSTTRVCEGGALLLQGVLYATVACCDFTSNRARHGGAGAISQSNTSFEYCRFQQNAASDFGGAVFVFDWPGDHQVSFSRCTFSGNHSDTRGGAVAYHFTGPRFEDCLFLHNSAERGGAVDAWGSGTTMVGCTLKHNSASTYGGALYNYDASWPNQTILRRCLITENTADSAGGGVYVEENQIDVERCTIVRNSTTGRGSAIFNTDFWSYVRINSTIVAFNRGTCAYAFEGSYLDNSYARYNNFFGNDGGDYWGYTHGVWGRSSRVNANGDSCDSFLNIYLDPFFADTAVGDYRLTEDSPCIDAGDPSISPDPDSTIADIGAFYYWQPQSAHREPATVPARTGLLAAYPNPFNAQTVLRYDLAQAGRVRLTVFDLLGREVAVLKEGFVAAGSHSAVWDAEHLPSGLYFAALETGSARSVQKVVLLR